MRYRLLSWSLFAFLSCFMGVSVSYADPGEVVEQVSKDVRDGKLHKGMKGPRGKRDFRGKKELKGDQKADQEIKKNQNREGKPVLEPRPDRDEEGLPPKHFQNDKIKPDDKGVRNGRRGHRMNPDKMLGEGRRMKDEGNKRQSRMKKEMTPEQKECRINRAACRQDCQAEKKSCGEAASCAESLKQCKAGCNQQFKCQ